jgi:hypothetical protein
MSEDVFDGRVLPPLYGEHAGLFFRTHCRDAGQILDGHQHYQDHWTFLLKGSIRVLYRNELAGDVERAAVFIAPYAFLVKAEVFHEITALEDGSVWQCVFVQPLDQSGAGATYHQSI